MSAAQQTWYSRLINSDTSPTLLA